MVLHQQVPDFTPSKRMNLPPPPQWNGPILFFGTAVAALHDDGTSHSYHRWAVGPDLRQNRISGFRYEDMKMISAQNHHSVPI